MIQPKSCILIMGVIVVICINAGSIGNKQLAIQQQIFSMQKKDPYASYAKTYKIYTVDNSKFVWDSSGNPKQPHTLILVKYHGGQNQRFYLTPSTNGKWRINVLSTGYCLRADSNNLGSILHFSTIQQAPEEEWELIEIKENTYVIKSASSGLVLDVAGNSYYNEAKVIMYNQHSGKNQQWILQKV